AVYFFADKTTQQTRCVGALLSDTMAITAAACAKTGLFVGRATDQEDDQPTRGKITTVHLPTEPNPDIAIVELDRKFSGTHAVIAHIPLKDGYTISSVASDNSGGFLAPRQGQSASVSGRMISETDTESLLVPKTGTKICAGDLGAPVCSSSSTQFNGVKVT